MSDALQSPQTLRLFPEKLFYKIGETSRVIGVESYVLRYWETEFPFICPRKSKSGQRIYTKKDIDQILLIKRLLYEERYTIDGVRRKLGGNVQTEISEGGLEEISEAVKPQEKVLTLVKERLRSLLKQL
ncbi:MAG: MerR family transcriptional regulator [Dissulfurispiraceae bacterium]